MASPLTRRHKQASETLLLCVAEVPEFLSCISDDIISQIPSMVHDTFKDLAGHVVHSQGHGIVSILETMENEDKDIEDILYMEDAVFDEGASPSTTVHALFGVYENVKVCESASNLVEAAESCDVTRQMMAKEQLIRTVGSNTSNKEVKSFDFITSEMEEDTITDRDQFDMSHTIFDTWQVLGPAELGMIVSPPAVGKTSALVALGGGMATNNEGELFHFSFENTLNQMVRKYSSNLLSQPNPSSKFIRNNMDTIRDSLMGGLSIECFAPGTVTPTFIQNRIEHVMEKKKKDKVLGILLDYLSLMKAVSTVQARHEQLATIVVAIKAMATYFDCPVWTGAQPQRNPSREVSNFKVGAGPVNMMASMEPPVLTMEDVGECWAYPQVVDYMLTINQTLEERQQKIPEARLFRAKAREPRPDAPTSLTVSCNFDYATCSVM